MNTWDTFTRWPLFSPTLDGGSYPHVARPLTRPILLLCWQASLYGCRAGQSPLLVRGRQPVLTGQESVTLQQKHANCPSVTADGGLNLNVAPLLLVFLTRIDQGCFPESSVLLWSFKRSKTDQDVVSIGGQAPHGHGRDQADRVQARGDYIKRSAIDYFYPFYLN